MKPTTDFANILLTWNEADNERTMPWKGEKDPYLVWLSEVMLQQTRVEQGLPYYIKFKNKYPTIKHLADAPEDEVMQLWQGLGYYSRARNLHYTAKHITYHLKGMFPATFSDLKKLKGVGDYTAAAIASFVFDEQVAVVDGNVIRVLSRIFGIETPFDTTTGKKEFQHLAQKLIDTKQAGLYNQAIMDFGSKVCTPQKPACEGCVFQKKCFAYQKNLVGNLPYRAKRATIKNRYFYYLLIHNHTQLLIQKRTAKDIWQNLYELPLIETKKKLNGKQLTAAVSDMLGNNSIKHAVSDEIVQMLSHRKIHFRFIHLPQSVKQLKPLPDTLVISKKDVKNYGFPKTIAAYLKEILSVS